MPHLIPPQLIQIAGVIDPREAAMLAAAGVQWLGLPLRLDVNCPDLSEDAAAELVAELPTGCSAVIITYENRAAAIAELCAKLACRHVQLHGDIAAGELMRLRSLHPELVIIKSLVITGSNSAELEATATELAPWVDVYITDTFDPGTGARGATGKVHDWQISRRLVETAPRPVILAGGLNAENVAAAIAAVRPAGVDTHTGVEADDGRKDQAKVRAFVANAKAAMAMLEHRRR